MHSVRKIADAYGSECYTLVSGPLKCLIDVGSQSL